MGLGVGTGDGDGDRVGVGDGVVDAGIIGFVGRSGLGLPGDGAGATYKAHWAYRVRSACIFSIVVFAVIDWPVPFVVVLHLMKYPDLVNALFE